MISNTLEMWLGLNFSSSYQSFISNHFILGRVEVVKKQKYSSRTHKKPTWRKCETHSTNCNPSSGPWELSKSTILINFLLGKSHVDKKKVKMTVQTCGQDPCHKQLSKCE